MLVNGTVYPYMEVEPKPYRFRVLNAANDRFLNLQLYVAADKNSPTTAGTTGAVPCTGAVPFANCTEVAMVPISVNPANQYALTPSGIPDATKAGPAWIQIGTEGGFLPAPVVVPQQPVGWNLNATTFNFGNVNQHSLVLGSAERADVIVDFTAFAGQTLILYNDAPAAYPAGVSVYDYYTGDGSQVDGGGAPDTLPGFGPNTRTVMQIRVAAAATAPLNAQVTLANLNAVFAKGPGVKRGVFEVSQDPIIVPQAAYGSAYRNLFPSSAASQYAQIADTQKTFQPINAAGLLQPAVTIPLQMKGIHDEMGGVYDTQFGRMSGMIGLSNPTPGAAFLSMYGYAAPPTDIISGSVSGSIVGSLGDGTQIWRVFHNGVDTHPIHVHLFNAQLLNRVGQDGSMIPPDATELGWKDTFRISPLEITFLAMKPIIPSPAQVPFEVPNSVRLIDPTLPLNAPLIAPPPAGWIDPQGVNINQILNHPVNFGWEYVWHCHILAHEEMDMMHSLAFAIAPKAPTGLSAVVVGTGSGKTIVLNWTDNSLNETGFTIQRASDAAFTTGLLTINVNQNTTTFSNLIGNTVASFYFRVFASNVVGDTNVYPASQGFPTKTTTSGFSNVVLVNTNVVPAAPSNVNATGAVLSATRARFTITWTDNSTTETGFRVQWARNAAFTSGVGTGTVGPNVTTFQTPTGGLALLRGTAYFFRVQSFNGAGNSVYVNFGAPTSVIVP
jgi:FtsP/CotA-like multicopper oxidase with cupredoxin domain